MAILSRPIFGLLAGVTTVIAHGHVKNLVIDGVYWQGYDPTSYPYMTDPPVVVGWTAADLDNGFVAPDAYQTSDIICHKNATNAGGHASVKAGDSISIQWTPTWPDSHHGPVIDYLASCGTSCETVDKTTLEFFKIDGIGYLNGSDPGTWATDVTWLVQIPASLAPGNYVLRHEIIALHSAGSEDGAQNYPQCFNLAVTGTGTEQPSGVLGTALYKETDPGILYNLYTTVEDYTMPGPAEYTGFPSSVAQSSSVATVTSSAITASGSASAASSATATSAKATTTTASAASTTAKSSSAASTTLTAVTTSKAATTSAAVAGQSLYGQCGGSAWTGATSCASGTCSTLNAYYAQCL
ncbi:Endoglucanase-4 [Cytospora mali]|uniref:lytic cellulose monooxygenase (C4-dehydrogenating) n=1 Tax=Cytospora mali TaxID=578113 RepID=A0A194USV9_CYTMA|nr:Endoglucanase-4 [Valsa mali var. pyri (nom. inval.)]